VENREKGCKMEIVRIILKILMWILIIGFGTNFVMQTISYSFYRNAKQMSNINCTPEHIQINDSLSGYGYNLASESDRIIVFFGGSNYIAYNSVGCFGNKFYVPFISVDFYGSQDSKGKMNLKSMQKTAVDLYNWAIKQYPDRKITVMGHSYGTGIAAYLASVKKCESLLMLAAYRDLSDLYNKIIPIFWGPTRIFISNNLKVTDYAKNVTCTTYIIGSSADRTLSSDLQYKVQNIFKNAEIKIFDNVEHEDYLKNEQVLDYINELIH
jgi:pimeloyl-ACP methyl ester carboxylesterase